MQPAQFDITIYQGQTFTLSMVWRDSEGALVDLTGYTARMHIRRRVQADEPLHELTTDVDGGITLGGALGTIELEIPAETSEAFSFRTGVYDLELVSGDGRVRRLLEGAVTLSPEVTR